MTPIRDSARLLDQAIVYDAQGKPAEAIAAMEKAVATGDPVARLQAALWQLYGSNYPRDETAAFAAVNALADEGHHHALRLASVMLAFGLGCPRNWSVALARMRQAADDGDDIARTDLDVLGDDDPAHWKAPRAELLLPRPRVEVYRNLLPEHWCQHVIRTALPLLSQAHVKDARTGQRTPDPMRTNTVALLELWDFGLVHYAITARLAVACKCAMEKLEPPKILRYQPGETYRDHVDFIDPDVPAFTRELREKGQRTRTPLVYLNDGYSGGETAFVRSGTTFRGTIGDLLVLRNTRAGGKPDRESLHAGLPPTSGEKWVWSTRVRTRPQLARLWRDF
tara:strand:+ start:514 stop:1527 length:1014 start_codon:yes stop_codon:yes gene_type:complete